MNESTKTELLSPSTDAGVLGVPPLGRVAAPPEYESTSSVFYFWVDRKQSVERTQIVTTSSSVAGHTVRFVGIVQEVYRRSRQKSIGEESARFDGRSSERPPFDSEGVTYAEVAILRTEPVAHTPPTEESEVYLATPPEAARGYGLDRMGQRLDIGPGHSRSVALSAAHSTRPRPHHPGRCPAPGRPVGLAHATPAVAATGAELSPRSPGSRRPRTAQGWPGQAPVGLGRGEGERTARQAPGPAGPGLGRWGSVRPLHRPDCSLPGAPGQCSPLAEWQCSRLSECQSLD